MTVLGFFSPVHLTRDSPPARAPVPYVSVRLELELFRASRRVSFLIDTGSDTTVINPQDSLALIPPDGWPRLRNPVSVRGAGAGTPHFPEPAVLHFRHEDGRIQSISSGIYVALPYEQNRRLDSVLGRDLLAHFSMLFTPAAGILTLD